MTDSPKVSFVITLFNYVKYIKDCIASIRMQDYKNVEIIVIDDCSTDGSYDVVKGLNCDVVKRMESNSGYSFCKNQGIIASSGELISVFDADDMLTPGSISSRVKIILEYDVSFVYGDAIAIFDDMSLSQCLRLKGLPEQTPKTQSKRIPSIERCPSLYGIHAQTVMLKRDIYRTFGLYDDNLRARSDREMWWRLFGRCESDKKAVTSYYLNIPLAYYRYHRKSMRYKRQKDKEKNRDIIMASEQAYERRKKEGITKLNTRFLD